MCRNPSFVVLSALLLLAGKVCCNRQQHVPEQVEQIPGPPQQQFEKEKYYDEGAGCELKGYGGGREPQANIQDYEGKVNLVGDGMKYSRYAKSGGGENEYYYNDHQKKEVDQNEEYNPTSQTMKKRFTYVPSSEHDPSHNTERSERNPRSFHHDDISPTESYQYNSSQSRGGEQEQSAGVQEQSADEQEQSADEHEELQEYTPQSNKYQNENIQYEKSESSPNYEELRSSTQNYQTSPSEKNNVSSSQYETNQEPSSETQRYVSEDYQQPSSHHQDFQEDTSQDRRVQEQSPEADDYQQRTESQSEMYEQMTPSKALSYKGSKVATNYQESTPKTQEYQVEQPMAAQSYQEVKKSLQQSHQYDTEATWDVCNYCPTDERRKIDDYVPYYDNQHNSYNQCYPTKDQRHGRGGYHYPPLPEPQEHVDLSNSKYGPQYISEPDYDLPPRRPPTHKYCNEGDQTLISDEPPPYQKERGYRHN